MARGTATVKIVTTVGKVYKQADLIGQVQIPFTTIALGIGTSADAVVADTGLQSEIVDSGLARVVVVPTGDNAGVMTWAYTFTATAAKTISEMGIFSTGMTYPGVGYIHITLGSSNDVVLAAGDSFRVVITDAE